MNPATAALLARGFLAANRVRLALTVASIALGVALAGAVHTVHTSALAEVDRAARALSGAADLEVRGPRDGFDDGLFATIAAMPGVAAASPVVDVLAAVPGREAPLRVLGIDPFRAVRLQPAFVTDGRATGSGRALELLRPGTAWLSPPALAQLGVREGDSIRLVSGTEPRAYRVGGVLPGLQAGGAVAVMDIAVAQLDFGRLGKISRIELRLARGADAAQVRKAIAAVLPPGVVVEPAAALSGRAATLTRAYRVNLDALALVALATGVFLVFSTLALQAARRRQEFGLLRALGLTRHEIATLLAFEGAAIGAAGAALGTLLGLAASRMLLRRSGGDLGAGFFESGGSVFAPDPVALAGIALLGIAASAAASLWVSRSLARLPIAEALRDRAGDLPLSAGREARMAMILAAAGVPFLFAPPIAGLPLAGYTAIALWLAAAVAAVGPVCRGVLARLRADRDAVAGLALAQVRHLPGHLAASVAGIVVSAALCAAMAILVFSFRASVEQWLHGVVGADIYVRAGRGGDTGFFTPEQQARIAALPAVRAVEAVRFERLAVGDARRPFTLVARPVDARILAGFLARPAGMPPPGEHVPVWMSEAARELHGWRVGDTVSLPIGGRRVPVRIVGTIRDYARTWGAVIMPIEDFRRLTGDGRANDLGLHLAPGADADEAQAAIRAALGPDAAIAMEDAAGVHRRSLQVFDRSFAVTYLLEAIAIAIGLAGVTSSFAALAWSRRREFGVLRFLGLTRREVLSMLAIEGLATGALGAALGLAAGAAISLVLVHVVNRQSFHWGLEVHWPVGGLLALAAAIVLACAFGARASGALAVRREAVLAVKDDA